MLATTTRFFICIEPKNRTPHSQGQDVPTQAAIRVEKVIKKIISIDSFSNVREVGDSVPI